MEKDSRYLALMDSEMTASELRRMRKAAGLTQPQLAEKLGKSQNFVTMIETGKRSARPAIVEAWARACGFSVLVEFVPEGVDGDMARTLARSISEMSDEQKRVLAAMIEAFKGTR